MITPCAQSSIQLLEDTQPETAPGKPRDKESSEAAASDFSRFVGQFLGTVVLNTLQAAKETGTEAGPRPVAAQPVLKTVIQPTPLPEQQPAPQAATQPIPQPEQQPVANAAATRHENAAALLGITDPDALLERAKETEQSNTPASKDAVPPKETIGSEEVLVPASAGHTVSDKAAAPAEQKKPDLHTLLAKKDVPGTTTDERRTGEPADPGINSTPPARGDFQTIMHHESSGAHNVQAQISGATVTHTTHETNGPAPLRTADAADVLNTAQAIVKDGSRLAVKFEQDGLGKLDIDLRLNKGMINAHIQAADTTTKTLIENNMQQIVDSLLKAGLSVGGFSVSLKGGGRQNGSPEELYGYGTERAAGITEKAAGSAQRAAAESLISIFI